MGKKAKLPESLFAKVVNPINEKYIKKYREFLVNEKIQDDTINTYIQDCERILKYKTNWDIAFRNYTEDTYINFVVDLLEHGVSNARINSYSATLKKFKESMIKSFPNEYNENFLKNIERLDDNETKIAPARPLTIVELNEVKEFIKSNNQEKIEYIFNIFYYLGIKKSDYEIFNPMNANFKDKCYEKKGIRKYFNEFNFDFESSLEKVKGKKITKHMIDYHLPRIAEHLMENGYYSKEKAFTYDDIRKTRDKYFLECPCCEREIENIASNWVIVQYDFSEEKQLVCKYCKGVQSNE